MAAGQTYKFTWYSTWYLSARSGYHLPTSLVRKSYSSLVNSSGMGCQVMADTTLTYRGRSSSHHNESEQSLLLRLRHGWAGGPLETLQDPWWKALDSFSSPAALYLFLMALAFSSCLRKNTLCLPVPVGLCSRDSSWMEVPNTPKVDLT